MSDVQSTFKKYLREFETKVLNRFGYFSESNGEGTYSAVSGILSYRFVCRPKQLKISMFASEFEDGRKAISMQMFKWSDSDKFANRPFSLLDYLEEHKITDIRERCGADEVFEAFTKEYFAKLEIAFDTYLHDQVTGVRFESHNPLGK